MIRETQVRLDILNEAKRKCLASNVKRAKMCAFLMDGDRIFTHGYNRSLYGHPNKFTQHAEEHILYKIKHPYGTMIILRYSPKSDTFRNSRPCDRCMKQILRTDITKIIYNLDGVFYEERIK